MARYSVESTMPAALSDCQGLLSSAPGLDAAGPEARLPSPSCASAGHSILAVLEGEHMRTAVMTLLMGTKALVVRRRSHGSDYCTACVFVFLKRLGVQLSCVAHQPACMLMQCC